MDPLIVQIETLMRNLMETEPEAIYLLEKLLSRLRVECAVEKSTALS